MRNKGFFRISNKALVLGWEDISLIFKDFRPIHIELRQQENDTWYYYGVSFLFEEIEEGACIPQYDIEFSREDINMPITYKFIKV